MGDLFLLISAALISVIILFTLFFLGYKLSHKIGVKKALYRTTYIIICVGVAFLITKPVTGFLLHFDLRKVGMEFSVNGVQYNLLIDFLEGFIVYNDVFVTLYEFFPSLRELFTEVPHLLVTPFAFIIIFFFISLIFYPIYLLASYEEKRISRRASNKNQGGRLSGVLGGLQAIFLFSIILLPINGVNRAYQSSLKNTLTNEKSLCTQIESLSQFKQVCDAIDLYNATAFAKLAGEYSIDQALFRGVTSTQYGDKTTNIEKEISLIIRSTLILDQSGIIYYLNSSSNTNDEETYTDIIDTKMLSKENIELIIESITESKYTNSVINDLLHFLVDMLNAKLAEITPGHFTPVTIEISQEDLEEEVRIIFQVLAMMADFDMLDLLLGPPLVGITPGEIIQGFNIDNMLILFNRILDSKTFTRFLYPTINNVLADLDVYIEPTSDYDFRNELELVADVLKIVQKYETEDFFYILYNLEEEDKPIVANLLNGIVNSEIFSDTLQVLFDTVKDTIELTGSMLDRVDNWENELELIISAIQIYMDHLEGRSLDFSKLTHAVKSASNSKLAQPVIKSFMRKQLLNTSSRFFTYLAGIGNGNEG